MKTVDTLMNQHFTKTLELWLFFLLALIANDFKHDTEMLDLAVGALRNLMLDSAINRGRSADEDGLLILTNVYFTSANNNLKQQCLGALKNLVGNSW